MSRIDQRTYELAREWLESLGILCAGNMTVEDAKMRCTAYASMAIDEFPASAFNQKSLGAIARKCKFFPSWGELSEHLSAWCKENKPEVLALPSGHRDAFTSSDASWLATWHRHTAEGFVNVPNCPRYPHVTPDTPDNHRRAHVASMIQRFSPAAWARIAGGQA